MSLWDLEWDSFKSVGSSGTRLLPAFFNDWGYLDGEQHLELLQAPVGTQNKGIWLYMHNPLFPIFEQICWTPDSVMTTAERAFSASTAEQDILSLFWKREKLCRTK